MLATWTEDANGKCLTVCMMLWCENMPGLCQVISASHPPHCWYLQHWKI